MENIKLLIESVLIMLVLSISLIFMRADGKAKKLSFWKKLLENSIHSYLSLPMILLGLTVSLNLSGKANTACFIAFSILLVAWIATNGINIDGILFFISGVIAIAYYWTFVFGVMLNGKFNDLLRAVTAVILCIMACIFTVFFVSEAVISISKHFNIREKLSLKNISIEVALKAVTAALPTITSIINILKALKIIK